MLKHLISQSRTLLIGASFASVVHGACSVFLLAQISFALAAEAPDRGEMALIFAGTAVAVMLSYMVANILFERLGQRAHAELRSFIAKRVIASDYRHLEVIGAARVQSALSEHCTHVAEFFVSFPVILTNAVIIIGYLIYMALLSWQVFLLAVIVIGLGSFGYHLAHLRAIRHLDVAAQEQNRPFFMFDEWAADQDPVFKEVFYREVLPELRAMGKAVSVISHDDRYFHLADRLIRMESGCLIVNSRSPMKDSPAPEKPSVAYNSAV